MTEIVLDQKVNPPGTMAALEAQIAPSASAVSGGDVTGFDAGGLAGSFMSNYKPKAPKAPPAPPAPKSAPPAPPAPSAEDLTPPSEMVARSSPPVSTPVEE